MPKASFSVRMSCSLLSRIGEAAATGKSDVSGIDIVLENRKIDKISGISNPTSKRNIKDGLGLKMPLILSFLM